MNGASSLFFEARCVKTALYKEAYDSNSFLKRYKDFLRL